jgi:hypothetical protein
MFRRRSRSEPDDTGALDASDDSQPDDPSAQDTQVGGPWDSDEVPDDGIDRIDLGSLRVAPQEGTELRLQVDEQTGEVQSAMLAGDQGAIELRAFAAPRGGDLWAEGVPRSRPTSHSTAGPPPSVRAAGAWSWSARCRW